MEKKAKARRIGAQLNALYPDVNAPLEHQNTFTLLVAVLLSAQSTDKKVNQITPELFALAHTPEQMRQLTVAMVQKIIQPIGLAPQKARAIVGLSHILCQKHGGDVPDNFKDLEALPGVGHKTASVVMAQGFGHPAFPVDTHIHRLACRWGLSCGKNVVHTERDLKQLFPKKRWHAVHLQMIFFGRQHCPALRHDPLACPICVWAANPAQTHRANASPHKLPRKGGPQQLSAKPTPS